MSGSRLRTAVLLVATATVLTACAAGPNDLVQSSADAGFWLGLWHGIISPITFVVSLFTDGVNVYEVHNDGNWYDFGFVLGLSIAFGGSAHSGAGATRRSRARTRGDG